MLDIKWAIGIAVAMVLTIVLNTNDGLTIKKNETEDIATVKMDFNKN